ncbi:hypothetical protein EON65_22595 [archaeon]|nr:MAG: hypothetical protein EON65_22595 [archaeon]
MMWNISAIAPHILSYTYNAHAYNLFLFSFIYRSEAEDWSSAPLAFSLSTSPHPLMAEEVYVVYGGMFDGGGEEGRQKFPLSLPQRNVSAVSLRIHSNHGHAQYTCLYKLRVHGYV